MTDNLPFKAVDVEDRNGFKAALYAVNALYKRCGMECADEKKARKSVSRIIAKATTENIMLLLEDWYSTKVDEKDVTNLLSELPRQIYEGNESRYANISIVNGIEWSALATIFRCSIAVKIISNNAEAVPGHGAIVEWKVAVPSPKIFGLSTETNSGPATACVFILSHRGRTTNYYPLIPSNQFVFEPGKQISLKPEDDACPSRPQEVSSDHSNQEVEKDSPQQDNQISAKIPHQRTTNERKKQVHFPDETKARKSAVIERKAIQTPSEGILPTNEGYKPAERSSSSLTALTSRGSHPAHSGRGCVSSDGNLLRSHTYTIVEKTSKEKISKLSESSFHLSTVYQEARRNEREISCIEIYDRVYQDDM